MKKLVFTLLLSFFCAFQSQGAALALSKKTGPFFRFVIIVDSSKTMKRNKVGTLKTIQALLGSGFQGLARDGDVYGVWGVSDKLDATGFPPQRFVQSITQMQMARTVMYLDKVKFKGKSDLARAIDGVKDVTGISKEVYFFLITDGEDVVYGTPFDLDISTTLFRFKDKMRDLKLPFVVTVAALDGQLKAFSVESGGGGKPIFIPKVDPVVKEEPKKPKIKKAIEKPEPAKKTEVKKASVQEEAKPEAKPQPAAVKQVAKTPEKEVPEPRPVPEKKKIEIKAPEVKHAEIKKPEPVKVAPIEKKIAKPAVEIPKPRKEVKVVVTSPVKISPPTAKVEIPEPEKKEIKQPDVPKVAMPEPVAKAKPAKPVAPPKARETETVKVKKEPAVETKEFAVAAATALVQPVAAKDSGNFFLFIGLGLLFGGGFVAWRLFDRGGATGTGSVITQSLDRER